MCSSRGLLISQFDQHSVNAYAGDTMKTINKEDSQELRDYAESWERVGYARGHKAAKKEDMPLLSFLIRQAGGHIEISDLDLATAENFEIIATQDTEKMTTVFRTVK